MPYFLHGCLVEVFLALDDVEHLAVEVAEVVVVEFLIVDKVPLPACVLVAPSVALSWEVYPFGMSELVAHEV